MCHTLSYRWDLFLPSCTQVQGSYDSEMTQLQDSFQSKIVHLLSDTVSCVARLFLHGLWCVCRGCGQCAGTELGNCRGMCACFGVWVFLSLLAVGIVCEEGIPETQCWKVMRVFWTTARYRSLSSANVSFTMMLPWCFLLPSLPPSLPSLSPSLPSLSPSLPSLPPFPLSLLLSIPAHSKRGDSFSHDHFSQWQGTNAYHKPVLIPES